MEEGPFHVHFVMSGEINFTRRRGKEKKLGRTLQFPRRKKGMNLFIMEWEGTKKAQKKYPSQNMSREREVTREGSVSLGERRKGRKSGFSGGVSKKKGIMGK